MCMFSKCWVCGESLQGRFRRVSLIFCQVTIGIYIDCQCMCTTENLHHMVHSVLKCSVPPSTFLCTLLFFVSVFSQTGSSPMTHQHQLYCNITDPEFFPQAKFLIIFWPKKKPKKHKKCAEEPWHNKSDQGQFPIQRFADFFLRLVRYRNMTSLGRLEMKGHKAFAAYQREEGNLIYWLSRGEKIRWALLQWHCCPGTCYQSGFFFPPTNLAAAFIFNRNLMLDCIW